MKNNKTIIILITCIVISYVSYSFFIKSDNMHEKNNHSTTSLTIPLETRNSLKQNEMKSIAAPNWWKKPNTTQSPHLKNKTKKSPQQLTNNPEPITNFVMLSKNNEWILSKGKQGIASAKYTLDFKGKLYELSIIRMNKNIALESVLSIWQNKVGLVPNSPFISSPFLTKNKQALQLVSLKGQTKAVLLAVHKENKYTFFRFLGEQGIDIAAENEFKSFLSEINVTR